MTTKRNHELVDEGFDTDSNVYEQWCGGCDRPFWEGCHYYENSEAKEVRNSHHLTSKGSKGSPMKEKAA